VLLTGVFGTPVAFISPSEQFADMFHEPSGIWGSSKPDPCRIVSGRFNRRRCIRHAPHGAWLCSRRGRRAALDSRARWPSASIRSVAHIEGQLGPVTAYHPRYRERSRTSIAIASQTACECALALSRIRHQIQYLALSQRRAINAAVACVIMRSIAQPFRGKSISAMAWERAMADSKIRCNVKPKQRKGNADKIAAKLSRTPLSVPSGRSGLNNVLDRSYAGPAVIARPTIIDGLIVGDVRVAPNTHVLITGMVTGNVEIDRGATAEITGFVRGFLINRGGARIYGVIGALAEDPGGATSLMPGSVSAGVLELPSRSHSSAVASSSRACFL
jgi:hypothetical protein